MSTRVQARNRMGQFAAECAAAAVLSAQQIAELGANVARAEAPVKTGRLVGSIRAVPKGKTAYWSVNTPYAMFQEKGTGARKLPGNVTFFWENAGRFWKPGRNMINHPGNPGIHYMEYSYEAASAAAMTIVRANYPG